MDRSLSTKKKSLNLTVLQTEDPNIIDIIETFANIEVYLIDPIKKNIDKLGYNGVGHVVVRNNSPFYKIIILNKQG